MKFKFLRPCKRCVLLWKLSFSVASSPWFSTGRNAFSKFKNKKWNLNFCVPKMRAPEKNGPLQTLFHSLKVAILWRIAPFLIKRELLKKMDPANAVSFFENRHFLTHRPHSLCRENPISAERRPSRMPRIFGRSWTDRWYPQMVRPSRNSLCRYNRISRSRNSLCR